MHSNNNIKIFSQFNIARLLHNPIPHSTTQSIFPVRCNSNIHELRFEIIKIVKHDIVEATYHGILAISLTHKVSVLCFIMIGTYLPLRYSVFGGDDGSVFNQIACLLLRFESKYYVCCMGDYNARIENAIDIIEDIHDTISERKCSVIMISHHGRCLLNVLIDNSM